MVEYRDFAYVTFPAFGPPEDPDPWPWLLLVFLALLTAVLVCR